MKLDDERPTDSEAWEQCDPADHLWTDTQPERGPWVCSWCGTIRAGGEDA
jgi:hypothetical protein